MTNSHPFLAMAHKLADVARPVLQSYYRKPVEIDVKGDASLVTIADREIERAMRDMINAELPDHGILGEEHGSENLDAEYVWVLDPIDGTKSFIAGKPSFNTLIALCQNGKPVLGLIDQAILDERWIGVTGQATTLNDKPIKARACEHLKDATIFTTGPDLFITPKAIAGYKASFGAARHPIYGIDSYGYGLIAMGFGDVLVESNLQPYDFCAAVPVIEGAGGVITDWDGTALTINSGDLVIASGDARCHGEGLDVLRAATA
ncbi:inositol monophosphatase family protein [Thalassospira lucentensis]|uniref:inositol monophosphatase family protein n=1 Tax=Thalassospira lucentensis TaxID=168935 RepID=UPI0003B3CE25|nr:inositol monophosphatase family protein [Thalassospira lucentensis]RCK28877.1 histidinol phosphate phosphatase [Thalassospira lucentensis MCCC 1A00383 = DSM 14000]